MDMGRGRSLSTNDASTSRLHALIRWVDREWHLTDLRSRNGTYVSGARVPRDQPQVLREGQTIGLGGARADFEIVDVSPPRVFVRNTVTDEEREEDASGQIHLDIGVLWSGEDGWLLQTAEGDVPATPDRLVPWTLVLPEHHLPTARQGASLAECVFRFHIHRRTESVRLVLELPTGEVDLGKSENFYAFLVLARARSVKDGWATVEQLMHAAKMKKGYLDVSLGRVRRLVLLARITDGDDLYQVERGLRRLGVGPEQGREVIDDD